jgi:hypothetical protein
MHRRIALMLVAIGLTACAAHRPPAVPPGLPPVDRVALLPVLMDSQVYEAEVFENEHSNVVATASRGSTAGTVGNPSAVGLGALPAYFAEKSRERQAELDQAWATVEFHPRERVDAELRRLLLERGVATVGLADPLHHLHHARQNGNFLEWQQQADAVLDIRILDVGYYRSGSNYSPMLGVYAALVRTAYPEENGGTDYWFDSRPSKGDPNAFVFPPTMVFKSLDDLRSNATDVHAEMDKALVQIVEKLVADLQAKVRMKPLAATNQGTSVQ